jgi:hypothetical protein
MRAGFAVQAVVAGGLDYTGAPGSVVAAAVHGAKLLVTMAYANKRSTISSRALRSLLMLNSGGRISWTWRFRWLLYRDPQADAE